MNRHNIGVFWGPYTPLKAPQNISACSGGCRLTIWRAGMERKASCGALGGHFRWRRSWLAMVVLVNVGRWRLTSDQPTVGIVKNCQQKYFFNSYVYHIHSWHLTRQLNKEDLDLRTCNISWFLCLVFYGKGTLCGIILFKLNTFSNHVFSDP